MMIKNNCLLLKEVSQVCEYSLEKWGFTLYVHIQLVCYTIENSSYFTTFAPQEKKS